MAGSDDPPDDRDDAPTPAPDEPRARDIAASKSTADLEQKLDPETVAQLAAWFGLPSFTELKEREEREAQVEEPWADRVELQMRIAEVADEALLARVNAWRGVGDAMRELLPPPELHLVEIRQADPSFAEQRGSVADPREIEQPMWLYEIMRENAPQAILRDLHRPEFDFMIGYELPPPEPGLAALTGNIRALLTAPYTVRPETRTVSARIADTLAELRLRKKGNWAQLSKAEEAPPPTGEGSPPGARTT